MEHSLTLTTGLHAPKGNCKAKYLMLKCSDVTYFNEHCIPDEYPVLTFNFVGIINSSLSYVKFSGKKKKVSDQKGKSKSSLFAEIL